ncbi:nucleoside hydrolase [Bifidobacterium leontopitheci]|uniref:Nucleoside hydrolase n=1 Tax=Bifidobacterium leontopitheci TaxID=2650774 RepID=A0A6I1GK37_9BIFI|nr:nucleoside hydrolase [Bifidobacterium leontopitheci]KAB7789727.1 nucleoside hydrolase [Bifidobacterium leontopitheci]
MTRKLILDLDTGIDDALAIAYAIGSEQAGDVELIGITGTYGNVSVATGVRNALAVTALFGRDDIPVYPGIDRPRTAAEPLPYEPGPGARRIHGDNGIGDMAIPDSPRAAETTPAVDFIIDAAETYGRDLLIVPTGAMTTIAEVCRREPGISRLVGSITFMGGALTVPGNVTPGAEANIAQDPEAADYLVRSGVETTMIGLDVTHQAVLRRDEILPWRQAGTAAGDFLAGMTDFYIDSYAHTQPEHAGCCLHDPLAVAAVLDPTLIGTLGVNLRVDLDGPWRGRTIGDRAGGRLVDPHKTTQVAVRVDVLRFKQRFLDRVTALAAVR